MGWRSVGMELSLLKTRTLLHDTPPPVLLVSRGAFNTTAQQCCKCYTVKYMATTIKQRSIKHRSICPTWVTTTSQAVTRSWQPIARIYDLQQFCCAAAVPMVSECYKYELHHTAVTSSHFSAPGNNNSGLRCEL